MEDRNIVQTTEEKNPDYERKLGTPVIKLITILIKTLA